MLLITLAASALGQGNPPAAVAKDAAPLFMALEGKWSCAGAFANGKPLKADLTFEPSLDGRILRYTHIDQAPNTYRQQSSWGVDKESGKLVSIAFTAFGAASGVNGAFYVAENWSSDQVRFVHEKLLAQPFAPNRFTYTISGGRLKMLWEVGRNGEWKMGDYLDCDRAADAEVGQ